jgi:hypothetical protein
MREHTAVARTALLDRDDDSDQPATPSAAASPMRVLGWGSLVARLGGAAAVLVIGAIHLDAYGGPYSAVPTIGVLFLLNVFAAAVIGVTLLAPVERLLGRRSSVAVVLVTTAGIGLAVVSLLMLIVAERGILFGFHEPGYDPEAIWRSRVAEIVAACLLTTSVALRALAPSRPRW